MGAVQRSMTVVGAVLVLGGLAAFAAGALSADDLRALGARTAPVLGFVAAVSVVAELADRAGVFAMLVHRAERLGRGRVWVLWLVFAALAVVATIFLSLDTTAVLLTPVVVLAARRLGLDPLPFAFTTVWLANTGSLLLPVSNLTNLLAHQRLGGPTPWEFAELTWRPALVAILVPMAVIAVVFARTLRQRYRPAVPAETTDRTRRRWSCVVLVVLLPALVSGVAPWIPATIAALALALIALVRGDRRSVRPSLVPWPLLLFAGGLFVAMEALVRAIPTDRLDGLATSSTIGAAMSGAVGANLLNNLPAYLALEPIATDRTSLVALLVGVNAGPLITPWASLATLLWHQRLEAAGVRIPWGRFVLLGAVTCALTVPLAAWTV